MPKKGEARKTRRLPAGRKWGGKETIPFQSKREASQPTIFGSAIKEHMG